MNWTARMKVSAMVLLVVAAVAWTAASSAAAEPPYIVGYYNYPAWSVYTQDYVPYFAQNPPVYYSYPVPRTYGFSPYAYPPGTVTPELLPLRPAVSPTSPIRVVVPAKVPVEQPRAKPLRIKNPYVK